MRSGPKAQVTGNRKAVAFRTEDRGTRFEVFYFVASVLVPRTSCFFWTDVRHICHDFDDAETEQSVRSGNPFLLSVRPAASSLAPCSHGFTGAKPASFLKPEAWRLAPAAKPLFVGMNHAHSPSAGRPNYPERTPGYFENISFERRARWMR
jgi:hypothetical protein